MTNNPVPQAAPQDVPSSPAAEEQDLWTWAEPEPVTEQVARTINSNILSAMNQSVGFSANTGDRFQGFDDFILSLYSDHSIRYDTIQNLARYLQCLRAASTVIKTLRSQNSNDLSLIDGTTPTLGMLLGTLQNNPETMNALNIVLTYTEF